jgi:hypothetical protein
MKTYSINDLLYGQQYYPRSIARKHLNGEINYSEERSDVYTPKGYKAFAIRFNGDNWATISVKVEDN